VIAWTVDHGVPYVFSVAVIREARGRGIATALLRHAMATVAAEGYREMTLSVDAMNPTGAVRVYEKVGMSVYRSLAVYDRDLA
jgi:ribosomal protein S18 acetylase RimI-like enzyme